MTSQAIVLAGGHVGQKGSDWLLVADIAELLVDNSYYEVVKLIGCLG